MMQHDFLLLNPVSLSALVILLYVITTQDTLSYCVGVFPLFLFQYLLSYTYNLFELSFVPSVSHYKNGQIGRFLNSKRCITGLMLDLSMPGWIIQVQCYDRKSRTKWVSQYIK